MKIKKLKNAFTLAEVLVSLTIVGVIAAIAIPVISMNAAKKANFASYKKAVLILNEIVERATTESRFQPVPGCFYWDENNPYSGGHHCSQYSDTTGECIKYVMNDTGEPIPGDINGVMPQCEELYQYIKSNLNVVKECSRGYYDGCMPEYNGNDTVFRQNNPSASDIAAISATSGCGNWRKENIKNLRAFVTADGMLFFPYSSAQLMAVDVNGKKGPNKWGFDVWQVILQGHNGVLPTYYPGGCDFIEKGGTYSSDVLKEI